MNQSEYTAKKAARAFVVGQLHAAHPHLTPASECKGGSLIAASKNVRTELARAFPGVKFSVKTSRYSGGDSMRVRWIDGPTTEQVEDFARKYSGGSFDGMTDSYTHDDDSWTDAFGEAKYVFCERDYSDKAIQSAIRRVSAKFGLTLPADAVEVYKRGEFYGKPICSGATHRDDIQRHIGQALAKQTWRIAQAA